MINSRLRDLLVLVDITKEEALIFTVLISLKASLKSPSACSFLIYWIRFWS